MEIDKQTEMDDAILADLMERNGFTNTRRNEIFDKRGVQPFVSKTRKSA